MQDPSSTAQSAITFAGSAGITLFGIVLGLRPDLMLAGLWGALWSLTYLEPISIVRRCALAVTSSVIAGYGTPAAMVFVEASGFLHTATAYDRVQYFVAMAIGFLAHRTIGPWLIKAAERKAEEIA